MKKKKTRSRRILQLRAAFSHFGGNMSPQCLSARNRSVFLPPCQKVTLCEPRAGYCRAQRQQTLHLVSLPENRKQEKKTVYSHVEFLGPLIPTESVTTGSNDGNC